MKVTLYFSDQQVEYLVGEKRRIPRRDRLPERAKAVLEELIRGPRSELLPTIPRGTRVRGVTIGEDGVCTVDFDGAIVRNHPGGTSSELMTVYSIVESLTKNVTGVQTVRILVEGEPRETFAGHLFIGAPLGPEPLYVRRGPS
jgi:germination protein M